MEASNLMLHKKFLKVLNIHSLIVQDIFMDKILTKILFNKMMHNINNIKCK